MMAQRWAPSIHECQGRALPAGQKAVTFARATGLKKLIFESKVCRGSLLGCLVRSRKKWKKCDFPLVGGRVVLGIAV